LSVKPQQHGAHPGKTGLFPPVGAQELGSELAQKFQVRDVRGNQPEPLRGQRPRLLEVQPLFDAGSAPTDFGAGSPVIVFKGRYREMIDVNQVPGFEVSFQVGHQRLDFLPVVEGIEVFLNTGPRVERHQ